MTEPQRLTIPQTPNTNGKVREADPSNDYEYEAIRKDRQSLLRLRGPLSKSTYRYQKLQPSHPL